jgi:hypothetical protein
MISPEAPHGSRDCVGGFDRNEAEVKKFQVQVGRDRPFYDAHSSLVQPCSLSRRKGPNSLACAVRDFAPFTFAFCRSSGISTWVTSPGSISVTITRCRINHFPSLRRHHLRRSERQRMHINMARLIVTRMGGALSGEGLQRREGTEVAVEVMAIPGLDSLQ